MPPGAGPNQVMPPNQRPGMPNMMNFPPNLMHVTPEHIKEIRDKQPKAAKLPDEQIRRFIITQRQRQHQEMVLRQQQQQNAMVASRSTPGMPGPGPQQQPGQGMQGPGVPATTTQPQNVQAAQAAQQRQQNAAAESKAPASAAARAANAPNANRAGPNKAAQQPTPSPAAARKNLKRPSPDDTADAAPATAQQPTQAPGPQRQQMPVKMPQFTAEQLASMTPEQRAKLEQLRRAQSQSQENVWFERLKQIGQEEQRSAAQDVMADIPMSAEERQQTLSKLQSTMGHMGRVGKVLGKWFAHTRDETRARKYFSMRLRLIRQFEDGDQMQRPKDTFSLRQSELDDVVKLLESMVKDISNKRAPAGAPPQGQTGGNPPAPLSAANLEKQTQALNKMHNRSNSKSGQAPAAPTTSQPPFQLGAQSPHGQPAYVGKPTVNRDNLQLPPRKKTKTGTEHPTPPNPSQATPSPQISKTSSPEVKRQPEVKAPPPAPPKPAFLCSEPDCEMASTGFPSEQARQAHIQEEHVKPLEDPIKFMQENLADYLGLDSNGRIVADAQAAGAVPIKQGLTPVSTAATPMSRDVSMQRTASKVGGKLAVKGANAKAGADKAGEAVASGAVPQATMDPWANTVDPSTLFQKFGTFDFGMNGAMTNMSVYRALTPNDTPESSKDSGLSEPNSEISENAGLDIDINWQSMDAELLMDIDKINMDGLETLQDGGMQFDASMFGESISIEQYPDWDDVHVDFDKPVQLDASLYGMDV